jgi:hypothetical protein
MQREIGLQHGAFPLALYFRRERNAAACLALASCELAAHTSLGIGDGRVQLIELECTGEGERRKGFWIGY